MFGMIRISGHSFEVLNKKIVKEFSHLPDDTLITTRQENQESIHRHNAFAEKVSTLGSLKEELNIN